MQLIDHPFDPAAKQPADNVAKAVATLSSKTVLRRACLLWAVMLGMSVSLILAVRLAVTVPMPW